MSADLFLEVDGIKTEPEAVTWALNAAVQQRQNTVYQSEARREEFREAFKSLMRGESSAYKQYVPEEQHCAKIRRLSEILTRDFGSILTGGRLRYGTAQKAFNLYLKYLWRFKSIATPPHCPIDGVVLQAAGLQGSWTSCDSETEYLSWVAAIRKRADAMGLSLAEWEHQVWLDWRIRQAQPTAALPRKQSPYFSSIGHAPSVTTPSAEFERAYASAPICWAFDSANPRFIYLSRDNRESTQASFRFGYAEVLAKLRPGRLSKKGYKYFEPKN